MDVRDLGERLYQASLLSFEWAVFAHTAQLVFATSDERILVHIDRIHCVVARQSLLGPSSTLLGPNCDVHYAEVSRDTKFLDRYLNEVDLLPSRVIPYDSAGRAASDAGFEKPYHLSIVCSDGDLDIVADVIEYVVMPELEDSPRS